MKNENKKGLNKPILPIIKRTLSILSAALIAATGLAACKPKINEQESSDITTSISTSSSEVGSEEKTSSVEDSSESNTPSNDESMENISSELNSTTSINNSSNTTNNSSKKNNSSTKNSNNGTTGNNSTAKSSNISSANDTPSVPSTKPMPSSLTKDNINDVEVFKHFARQLRNDFGHNIIIYNEHMTQAYIESELALALMNYEYVNNTLISQLFGEYSLEELKQFGEFMCVFIGMAEDENKILNYSKYFVNRSVGDYLVSFETEMIKLYKGEANNMNNIITSFYSEDSNLNYTKVNAWVNFYIKFLYSIAEKYDDTAISDWSLGSRDCDVIYYDEISRLYTKSN